MPDRGRRPLGVAQRLDFLFVESQHLLVERAEAAFRRGHPVGVLREPASVDAKLGEHAHEIAPAVIGADHRNRYRGCAERDDVGDDIAGAAHREVSPRPRSTGMGASGEIRSMTPLTKRSRMKSPTTSTVTLPNREMAR